MLVLFLFLQTSTPISTVATLVYIPTNNVHVPLPHIFTRFVVTCFLVGGHPCCFKFVFLMETDAEHFLKYLLAIYIFFELYLFCLEYRLICQLSTLFLWCLIFAILYVSRY